MDPGWQEPDEDAALRRTMQRHVEDLADIFQQVQRSARGKPTAEVRAELERGLRERDIPFPPDALDDAARSMAEPNWPLRHPIEFVRWVRDGKRKTAQVGVLDPDDDPEWARLERLLDDRPEVRGFGKFRTHDGWSYVVRIDPWSERRARRIRRICAPLPVTVRPSRPGMP